MSVFLLVLVGLFTPAMVDGQFVRKAKPSKIVEVYQETGKPRTFTYERVQGGYKRVWFENAKDLVAYKNQLNVHIRVVQLTPAIKKELKNKEILTKDVSKYLPPKE